MMTSVKDSNFRLYIMFEMVFLGTIFFTFECCFEPCTSCDLGKYPEQAISEGGCT